MNFFYFYLIIYIYALVLVGSRQIGPLANWAPSDFCGKLGPGRLGPGKLGPRQIGPRKILGAANWAPENLLVANWAPANWAPADWAPWRQIGPQAIFFLPQIGTRQIGHLTLLPSPPLVWQKTIILSTINVNNQIKECMEQLVL